jgi:2'-5' RNA ligase
VPPAAALDHLDGALARLRDRPGAPRWARRDALHVTLAFFGEVPDARVDALTAALRPAAAGPPLHLRLTGAGTFPRRGAPRVLWVGLDGDVEQLASLAAAAAGAARAAGLPLEHRAYRPHLTVGRWPATAPADRSLVDTLARYAGPYFGTGNVQLLRSVLGGSGGARYETVARLR